MTFTSKIKTIEWVETYSRMIDQTILPHEFKTVDIKTCDEMYDAIKTMIVRGAPAIGIAGAQGVSLAAIEVSSLTGDVNEFLELLSQKAEYMKSARPTAVNLMWAVDKQMEVAKSCGGTVQNIVKSVVDNGKKMEIADIEINKKIWV